MGKPRPWIEMADKSKYQRVVWLDTVPEGLRDEKQPPPVIDISKLMTPATPRDLQLKSAKLDEPVPTSKPPAEPTQCQPSQLISPKSLLRGPSLDYEGSFARNAPIETKSPGKGTPGCVDEVRPPDKIDEPPLTQILPEDEENIKITKEVYRIQQDLWLKK